MGRLKGIAFVVFEKGEARRLFLSLSCGGIFFYLIDPWQRWVEQLQRLGGIRWETKL
jgi:hypothetical protein